MKKCITVRMNRFCPFMGAKQCTFTDGHCNPVVDKCEGCKNTETYNESLYCKTYMNPESMWLAGRCPMCTVQLEKVKVVEQKINPLKASKKAAKARMSSSQTKQTTSKKKK